MGVYSWVFGARIGYTGRRDYVLMDNQVGNEQ